MDYRPKRASVEEKLVNRQKIRFQICFELIGNCVD
jgi:hypothetical protein